MNLVSATGFFSYAHSDDYNHKLTDLKDDLCSEYKVATGEKLNLFFDRTSIRWGEYWESAITSNIGNASFFIPILSPSYFSSAFCIQELRQYLSIAKASDAHELVLPILFSDITSDYLTLDKELVESTLAFQYEDWTNLRFMQRDSEPYLRAVNRMAQRIIEANKALQRKYETAEAIDQKSVLFPTIPESNPRDENDNDEFFLESLQYIEDQSPSLTDDLDGITEIMKEIAQAASEGTEEIRKASNRKAGAKGVIAITVRMSNRLESAAADYERRAKSCSKRILDMDPKMRNIVKTVNELKESGSANEDLTNIIKSLGTTANGSIEQLSNLVRQIQPVQRMSRALYKPLKTIEYATETCMGAFELVAKWGETLE